MKANRWLLGLALAAGVLTPAGAQTPEVQRQVESALQVQRQAPGRVEKQKAVAEEVEILRRLLERQLVGLYGSPGGTYYRPSTAQSVYKNWATGLQASQDPGAANQALHFYLGYLDHRMNPSQTADPNNPKPAWNNLAQRYRSQGGLASPLEGTYLPGYGVVYTVTLPPPAKPDKPAKDDAKPAPKLSAWEEVARQVQGEAGLPVEKARAEDRPPSITDTVLQVLLENGANLKGLAAEERVTVAVTFRPGWGVANTLAAQDPTNDLWLDVNVLGGPVALDLSTPWVTSQNPKGGHAAANNPDVTPPGAGAANPENPQASNPVTIDAALALNRQANDAQRTIRDYVLLGDLHLKQGKAGEALATYAKAAEALDQTISRGWNWDAEQLQGAQEVYPKLAQAQLAAGQVDAARKTLEKLAKIPPPAKKTAEAAQAKDKPAEKKAPASPLPDKLILSVPKKTLDQAKANKLSLEEFRNLVARDHVTFEFPAPGNK